MKSGLKRSRMNNNNNNNNHNYNKILKSDWLSTAADFSRNWTV